MTRKLSRTQKLAIKKAKDLGLSYNEISKIFDVSIGTISYWIHHPLPEQGSRNRPLRLAKNGIKLTREVYRRPKPPKCELCGLSEPHNYHTWDCYDNTRYIVGLWLCGGCHWIAERVDRGKPLAGYDLTGEYAEYILLKEKAEEELKSVCG